MNAPAKLLGFLAVLGCVFGISFLTGTQSQALLAPVQTHDNQLSGLSSTDAGYRLAAVEPVVTPGADVFIELRLTGPDGGAVPSLDEVDGAPLHAIAFRRDLTGYQHVYPEQGKGSSWWPVLNLTPGPWHVIVSLQPTALRRQIALAVDFTVSGTYRPQTLPAPVDQVDVAGLTVARSGTLSTSPDAETTVTVTDSGRPVTDLQPAHNAPGHAVLIRASDLGYLHLHAAATTGTGPRLEFTGGVPTAGTYRMFVEFYRADQAHVAAYTIEVRR
jgi:hypothetical protein